MEIGPDETNNPNGFQREIKITGKRLEAVENFKYMGSSNPEILSRIAPDNSSSCWRNKNLYASF